MKTIRKAKTVAALEASEGLNITVVYQDALTRQWACQTCQRTAALVGPERLNITWWKTVFLNHPEVFVEAVGAAAPADILAFSVYGAAELPPELLAWIDAWLPRRQQRPGALLALIGVAEEADSQAAATREYLRAVTRKATLDFFAYDVRCPAQVAELVAPTLSTGGPTP